MKIIARYAGEESCNEKISKERRIDMIFSARKKNLEKISQAINKLWSRTNMDGVGCLHTEL